MRAHPWQSTRYEPAARTRPKPRFRRELRKQQGILEREIAELELARQFWYVAGRSRGRFSAGDLGNWPTPCHTSSCRSMGLSSRPCPPGSAAAGAGLIGIDVASRLSDLIVAVECRSRASECHQLTDLARRIPV